MYILTKEYFPAPYVIGIPNPYLKQRVLSFCSLCSLSLIAVNMASNAFPTLWSHCGHCGAGFLCDEDKSVHENKECLLARAAVNFQSSWLYCSHCGVAYLTEEDKSEHERACHLNNAQDAIDLVPLREQVQTSCYGDVDDRSYWVRCHCDQVFTDDFALLTHMEWAHFQDPTFQVIIIALCSIAYK